MILSKTAIYATRALAYMAKHGQKPYSASLLSSELEIPYKYLAQILTKLSKESELLEVRRGRDGGFVLLKDTKEIFLSDILKILEDYENYDHCILGCDQCDLTDPCMLHDPWSRIRSDINRFLKDTTIDAIINMPTFKH